MQRSTHRLQTPVTGLLIATALLILAAPPTFADENLSASDAPTPAETVAALQAAAPEVLAEDSLATEPEPAVTQDGPALEITGASVTTTIARDPAEGFAIGAAGNQTLSVKPLGVDGAASLASPVAGGEAVVATSTDPGVSTVIKPQEHGISTYTVISSPDSPERFSWNVGPDDSLTLDETGGVTVTDAHGATIAAVPPPWAKDKEGNRLVGVHFEVDGRTLTLVVPHRSQDVVYDVVADPLWFVIAAVARPIIQYGIRWAQRNPYINASISGGGWALAYAVKGQLERNGFWCPTWLTSPWQVLWVCRR